MSHVPLVCPLCFSLAIVLHVPFRFKAYDYPLVSSEHFLRLRKYNQARLGTGLRERKHIWMRLTNAFSGVRVTRSLVLCVCFCR